MRYTPKYKINTDLHGIEIVTKQYSQDSIAAQETIPAVKPEAPVAPNEPIDVGAFIPDTAEIAANEITADDPVFDDDDGMIIRRREKRPSDAAPTNPIRSKLDERRQKREEQLESEMQYDSLFGLDKADDTPEKKSSAGKIVGRTLAVVATVLILAVIAVYAVCFTIARGPSEKVRDLLVLSALQASATKWVPSLFLPEETVNEIWEKSQQSVIEVIDPEEYEDPTSDDPGKQPVDEWADAKDGMQFITLRRSTFKAYMLIVKDPSRVFTATSCDFANESPTYGQTIFQVADKYGFTAAINAGEYEDIGGSGTGDKPIGLIFQNGKCVWDDGNYYHTFIGLTNDNKLICRESMTPELAKSLGVRDAVMFQWNNVLIEQTDKGVVAHRSDNNIGTAQRTAIAQRADGAIILLVTDGRTASSIGATKNDIIDLLLSYKAVSAAMLDGGSSAMMYYRDYFDKYDVDKTKLDKYQQMGLVNQYKAFTTPRRMPTFFAVRPESAAN